MGIFAGDYGSTVIYGHSLDSVFNAFSNIIQDRSTASIARIVERVISVEFCAMERSLGLGGFVWQSTSEGANPGRHDRGKKNYINWKGKIC